jgi:hypothetical protein
LSGKHNKHKSACVNENAANHRAKARSKRAVFVLIHGRPVQWCVQGMLGTCNTCYLNVHVINHAISEEHHHKQHAGC